MSIKSTQAFRGTPVKREHLPTSAAAAKAAPPPDDSIPAIAAHSESPAIKNPFKAQLHAFAVQEKQRKSEIAQMESQAGPLNQNLRWARQAKAFVRAQLTHGSNALPDAKLSREDAKALYFKVQNEFNARLKQSIQQRSMSAKFGKTHEGRPVVVLQKKEVTRLMSEMLQKHGFGVCSHQAAAIYCYLIDRVPPETRVELCQFKGGDHEVVAIGLQPQADLGDIRTWGPHAVICDSWADREYPLSQLAEMRRPENDVKVHVGSDREHYLTGTLGAYDDLYLLPME